MQSLDRNELATGKWVEVKSKKSPYFRAAKELKEKLNST